MWSIHNLCACAFEVCRENKKIQEGNILGTENTDKCLKNNFWYDTMHGFVSFRIYFHPWLIRWCLLYPMGTAHPQYCSKCSDAIDKCVSCWNINIFFLRIFISESHLRFYRSWWISLLHGFFGLFSLRTLLVPIKMLKYPENWYDKTSLKIFLTWTDNWHSQLITDTTQKVIRKCDIAMERIIII